MIQTNKVKTMTKAAIFEKKEERKALYICHFYQVDYVLYGMLKSAISLTIAYGLGACMWVIYHAESLMTEKSVTDLFELGKQAAGWYVLALAVFLILSAVACIVRYQLAQKRLKGYRGNLRRLLKAYQEDSTAKE